MRCSSSRPAPAPALDDRLRIQSGRCGDLFVHADLFDDGGVALVSAILYLFVPAKILFFPAAEPVTPGADHRLAPGYYCGCCRPGNNATPPCSEPRCMPSPFRAAAARHGPVGRSDRRPRPLVGTISGRELLEHFGVGCVAFTPARAPCISGWLRPHRRLPWIGSHAVGSTSRRATVRCVARRESAENSSFGMGVCQAVVFLSRCSTGFAAERLRPGERPAASRIATLRSTGARRLEGRLTRPITTLCLGLLAVVGSPISSG